MTIAEMTNVFDILYNNVMSDSAPGLTEYEKSIFLTKAQDELVRAIYNNTFEGNEEMRRCLDVLITDDRIDPIESNDTLPFDGCFHTVFQLPENIMYIIIENAQYVTDIDPCYEGKYVPVSPALYDDLHKDIRNPFRGATARKVLRIEKGATQNGDSVVELLSKFQLQKYAIRYLRKPKPIILEDLSNESLMIEGVSSESACELNSIIHDTIVERAVELAKAAYRGR